MSALQNMLSTVLSLTVTLFVPAVVWVTLIAGLLHLIRDGIHQLHLSPRRVGSFRSKVRKSRIGG
jgi:hypothetical protein